MRLVALRMMMMPRVVGRGRVDDKASRGVPVLSRVQISRYRRQCVSCEDVVGGDFHRACPREVVRNRTGRKIGKHRLYDLDC